MSLETIQPKFTDFGILPMDETARAVLFSVALVVCTEWIRGYVLNRGNWPRSSQELHHGIVKSSPLTGHVMIPALIRVSRLVHG
jgi:hypothetical protein